MLLDQLEKHPLQFGGQIWFPEGFKLGAKFGSLRGLDWGPNLVPEGFRLGANGYIEALRDTLIPWMRQVAHNRRDVPWIFQQDSAPAHRAKKTQEFLKEEVNFWPPAWEMASKQSVFEPLGLWNLVHGAAGGLSGPPWVGGRFKVSFKSFWWRMDPAKIRAACLRFRPRLEQCVNFKAHFLIKLIK